jgi:hypothetical protein
VGKCVKAGKRRHEADAITLADLMLAVGGRERV